MAIEFRCTQCDKLLRIGDDAAGRQAKCPECGAILPVPAATTPFQSPPSGGEPGSPFAAAGPQWAAPDDGKNPFQNPFQAPNQYGQPPAKPHGGPMPGFVPNYLVQAILCTIFCCLPFGIVGIVFAAQVNGKLAAGDYYGAVSCSRSARTWCWVSFWLGILPMLLGLLMMLAWLGVAIG